MISCRNLLMGMACAALMFGHASAQAEEDNANDEPKSAFASKVASGENVVLFKIHDISPIKNENGEVTDCEFSLTLYNRSPKTIDAATMQLSWMDDGISNVIDIEEKLEISQASQLSSWQESHRSKTENFTSKNLNTTVVLPKIKPFRQVSLKSRLASDRCFLMLGNVDFSFDICRVIENKGSEDSANFIVGDASSSEGECKALFRYVSAKDPEYYREFQQVSFNEEAEQQVKSKKKDIEDIAAKYEEVMQKTKSIKDTLDSI